MLQLASQPCPPSVPPDSTQRVRLPQRAPVTRWGYRRTALHTQSAFAVASGAWPTASSRGGAAWWRRGTRWRSGWRTPRRGCRAAVTACVAVSSRQADRLVFCGRATPSLAAAAAPSMPPAVTSGSPCSPPPAFQRRAVWSGPCASRPGTHRRGAGSRLVPQVSEAWAGLGWRSDGLHAAAQPAHPCASSPPGPSPLQAALGFAPASQPTSPPPIPDLPTALCCA